MPLQEVFDAAQAAKRKVRRAYAWVRHGAQFAPAENDFKVLIFVRA